jgi:clan AA aspartic protease (TIGR02281 family)
MRTALEAGNAVAATAMQITSKVTIRNANKVPPQRPQTEQYANEEEIKKTHPDIGQTSSHPLMKEPVVPMILKGGVYMVPALINDAITLDFIVDTGSSDVTIPADVFATLMRDGTISKNDLIGSSSYVLADGSVKSSVTFRIRSLKVGSIVLNDVNASIGTSVGPSLLGQSFLGRFKSWSIEQY